MSTPDFRDTSLPLETRVKDLVGRLTLAEKVSLMAQYQAPIPRLGIKPYKHGTEAAHGISWLGKATSFPQVSGLASTWDPELLEEVGSVVSTEARAFFSRDPDRNGLTLWTPTVDMGRDPRWGRNEECWGEDPLLAGASAGAYIQGLQGRDPRWLKAVATLKHFLANNSEVDRGTASISLDPRNLREYYLRPFELCIKDAGAQSMMTSYNSVNGVPANLNPDLERIVRREWGFDGFVVSDAGDVTGTKREHGWAKTWSECAALSIRNGIDSITDETPWVHQAIQDALARGELSEADLDHALSNTFRVRFRLGEFDPDCTWASIGPDQVDLPDHRAMAARAAEASFVLLENRPLAGSQDTGLPLLPLSPEQHRNPGSLAILGPLADLVLRDWYSGSLPYAVSPRQGLGARFGEAAVSLASGNDHVRLAALSSSAALSPASPTVLSPAGVSAPFEVFHWGQDAITLRNTDTGKWLGTDDRELTCSAEEVFGWFTKEVFNMEPLGRSDASAPQGFRLSTWNRNPLKVQADGTLGLAANQPQHQGPVGIAAGTAADSGSAEASPLSFLAVTDGIKEAVEAARKAHTAVVCIGNHPLVNAKETIDRPHLLLAERQEALVRAVAAANPRTVVVIFGSYPLCSTWIARNIPAIVHAAHPGQETGTALAAILSGDRNPSGRLPTTWYHPETELPDILDYDIIRGKRTYQYHDQAVLWPFGHGRSYTDFAWSGLAVTEHGTGLKASLLVRNTGTRHGAEVVQIYLRSLDAPVPMPLRQLAGFAKVEIAPGGSQQVDIHIPERSLMRWLPSQERFIRQGGRWTIMASASALEPRLEARIEVKGETVPPRNIRSQCRAVTFDDCSAAVLDWNDEDPAMGSVRARRPDEQQDKSRPLPASWICFGPLEALEAGRVRLRLRVKGRGQVTFRDGSPSGPCLAVCDTSATEEAGWQTLSVGLTAQAGTRLCITLSGAVQLAWFQML